MTRTTSFCVLILCSAACLFAQAPASTPAASPEAPTLRARPSLGAPSYTSNATGMTEEELSAAQTMASRIDGWSPKSNQPAGVSLELRELSRKTEGDKTVISYALYGTNLPKDKKYLLGRWPLDEPEKKVLSGLAFDNQGRAICPGTPGFCGEPTKPNLPLVLPVTAARMEPIRFAIVSEDKTVRAYTSTVPFPNTSKDRSCTIQAVLGVPDRELVMIEGTGFTPSEPLKVHQSDPALDQDVHADTDGTVSVGVLHPLSPDKSGTVSVKITGASCAPEISYDFGPTAYTKVKAASN